MCTKKCKKCGWVYPVETKLESCVFCGTRFNAGYCKACGIELQELYKGARLCKSCYDKGQKARMRNTDAKLQGMTKKALYNMRRRERATKRYEHFVDKLKNTKMHTLTEGEWMEACRHFDGCALCGAKSIDARGYFIPFKEGGKYNAGNIIPLCERCASDNKVQPNPFIRMDEKLNRNLATYRGLSLDNAYKAADYLLSKLEECSDEQER